MADRKLSWRDVLPIHPAAERIPEATADEKRALAADLAEHGLKVPVMLAPVTGEPGRRCLLDGRTRLDLLEAAGVQVVGADGRVLVDHKIMRVADDAEAERLSLSLNIHRRHLNAEDRQKFLIQVIAAAPEKSDRILAKETGLSRPTVAKARKQGEATGKVLPVEKRAGADGKARKQPARKPTKAPRATPKPEVNPLIRAWDRADPEMQYEFIQSRGEEIVRAAFDVEAGSDKTVTTAVKRAIGAAPANPHKPAYSRQKTSPPTPTVVKAIADRAEARSAAARSRDRKHDD
jgi:hypothetical protein